MSHSYGLRMLTMLIILTTSVTGFSQEKTPPSLTPAPLSWLPRAVLFGGPSLVGNGYQTVAGNIGAGFLLKSRKLVGVFEARYMNTKKTDDHTLNNRHGHERFLQGRVFYPLTRTFYVGGGAQWSETQTTNYAKKSWRPVAGVGGDHFGADWSCRWQVMYIPPINDRWNALQGPEIQFWLPSPASKSHFFYRQTLGVYEFHTTFTDTNDPVLTSQQRSDRHSAAFLDFTFGWKF